MIKYVEETMRGLFYKGYCQGDGGTKVVEKQLEGTHDEEDG